MKNMSILIIVAVTSFMMMGCGSSGNGRFLPTTGVYTQSSWKTYTDVQTDVENIVVGKTTNNDLIRMGFDLEYMPNVKRLTYLDVMTKFKLDSPTRFTLFNNIELPQGVLKTLAAREQGRAYELSLESIVNKREGSVWLDVLGFRKTVHTTGWRANVLVLMVDDVVEYVLYSGERNIDRTEKTKNPLGPFQGFNGGDIIKAASEL
jgi:hypothetical protein